MRKLLSIGLVLLCLLSFAGCSQQEGSGNKPESTTGTTTIPASTSKPDSGETALHFGRGSWDAEGKVFVNESTGIRIQLSDDYLPIPDSELAQALLGSDEDLSSWTEEDFKTAMLVPDCGFNSDERGNTYVVYENLAAENATAATEDMFLTSVVSSMKEERGDLDAGEFYDLTLSGQNYRACDFIYVTVGIQVNQTMAVRKVGDYMTTVLFTQIKGRDYIAEMISFFK